VLRPSRSSFVTSTTPPGCSKAISSPAAADRRGRR
jgi:hypothetical protein